MIDFRTQKVNDTSFIYINNQNSGKDVGIYDNGIVFHYGRELTDQEIARIRLRQEQARKVMEMLEERQMKQLANKIDIAVDDVVEKKVDEVITRAFKK